MKKLLTVLFVCVACFCGAYPVESQISSPNGSTLVWDDALGDWRPLAGTASGALNVSLGTETAGLQQAIASITTAVTDLDSVLTTTQVTVGDTSQNIAALAGRNFVTVQNVGTQTIYLNLGSTPAATDDYQIYPQGSVTAANVDALATFSMICDTGATSTAVVVQGKR